MKRFTDTIKRISAFEITFRRWCFLVIFASAAIIGGAVTLVFTVDPHYRYRLPSFYDTVYYEVYATDPRLLKELDYNTFFIGSSMTRNFFLEDVDRTLGVKSAKFAAAGATTADLVKFCRLASEAKGDSLERIIFSLDIYSMNKPAAEAHYKDFDYLYRSDLKEEYRYFFSRMTYSHMFYLLKRKLRPKRKRKHETDINRMFSTEYDGMKFGWDAVMKDALRNVNIRHTMTPENPEAFEENLYNQLLAVIAENPSKRFTVYLAPYHVYTYCQSEQFGEADGLIKQRSRVMKELLKCPNVKLFDYQTDREIVCNDSYFSDVQHFGSVAARLILKKLASGKRQILSENCVDANEAELRALIAEHMPRYYDDLKKYQEQQK